MALGRLDVHAGDFERGNASQFTQGKFLMKTQGQLLREDIQVGQIKSIEMASEESIKRFGGSLVGGVVGGAVFGGAGLLAGALSGGTGKDVTFVCEFLDGRKMMATTDSKTWTAIIADKFDCDNGSGKFRSQVHTGGSSSPLKKAKWVAVGIWLIGGALIANAVSPTAPESGKQGVVFVWTVIVVSAWFVWKRKQGSK